MFGGGEVKGLNKKGLTYFETVHGFGVWHSGGPNVLQAYMALCLMPWQQNQITTKQSHDNKDIVTQQKTQFIRIEYTLTKWLNYFWLF